MVSILNSMEREDSEVPLSDISGFITKGATPTTYGFTWQPSGIPFLRSECVSSDGLDLRQSKFISDDANKALRRSQVNDGDILMTITGNVGRVVRLTNLGPANINQHIARIRVADERFDPGYVFHYLSQPHIRAYFESITTGQAYPQISLVQVRQTKISAIGHKQQREIAKYLDDCDHLISSIESLIAKKKAIKQGIMQQLLSGKTRLHGFGAEWAQTSMGECGQFSGAGVDKTSNPAEPPVRLLNYLDVYHEEFVYPETPSQMVTASAVKQRRCDVQAGDVFFTPTSETPDDIGRSAVSLQDVPGAVYSYHLVRWRPQSSWDPLFLGYVFSTEHFRSQLIALASGSGTRYVVSLPGFRSLKIAQPPLDEQVAIGKVLRDFSNQIEVLKNQLTKTRLIKQGMMQELLTGPTRLTSTGE